MYNDDNGTDYSSGSYNYLNRDYSYTECITIKTTITTQTELK